MDHPFIPSAMSRDNRESPAPPPALARIEAHVLRWPVKVPVRTSFGTMHDRPAVLVRVEDAEGAHGWGEAWCNFPSCGAEHRAAPDRERARAAARRPRVRLGRGGVRGADARGPRCWRSSRASRGRSPRRSPASTSPCTTWRRGARGLPLWRHLSRGRAAQAAARPACRSMPAASTPSGRATRSRRCAHAGYTAFKLKVGFGAERDVANLADVRAAAGARRGADGRRQPGLGSRHRDDDGATRSPRSAPAWLEEPLRADRPLAEWQRLAAASPIPLAAGENAIGEAAFAELVAGARRSPSSSPISPSGAAISGVAAVVDRIAAARPALLPALPRRRHRPARLGAPARRARRRRRLARGRCQREPAAHAALPAAGDAARTAGSTLAEAPGLGCEPDLAGLRALCA